MSSIKRGGVVLLKEASLREFSQTEIENIMSEYDLDMFAKLEGYELEKPIEDMKRFIDKNIEIIMSEGFEDEENMDCAILMVETEDDEIVKSLHKEMPLLPYYSVKVKVEDGKFNYIPVCGFINKI